MQVENPYICPASQKHSVLYMFGQFQVIEINNFQFRGKRIMEWINIFGAVFIVIIMIPNIIYALKCKDGFENKWNSKGVEIVEQIGRFGCLGFMVINIPGTWFDW